MKAMKQITISLFFLFTTITLMGQSMTYGKSLQEQIDISDEQVEKVDSLMTILMPEVMAAKMKDPENMTEEAMAKMIMDRLAAVLTKEQMGRFQRIVDEANQQADQQKQARIESRREQYAYLQATDEQLSKVAQLNHDLFKKANGEFPYDPKKREKAFEEYLIAAFKDLLSDNQIQLFRNNKIEQRKKSRFFTISNLEEEYGVIITEEQAIIIDDYYEYKHGFEIGKRRLSELKTLEQERDFMKSVLTEEQFKEFTFNHDYKIEHAREMEEKHKKEMKEALEQEKDIRIEGLEMTKALFQLQKDFVYPKLKDIQQDVLNKLTPEDLQLLDSIKSAYKVYLKSYEQKQVNIIEKSYAGLAPRANEKLKTDKALKQLIPTWDENEKDLEELGLRLILQTKEQFQKQSPTLKKLSEEIIDRHMKILSETMGPSLISLTHNVIHIERQKQQLFLSALLID